jgi:alkylation response protein AidB-like acyl-CoA dehydrogenase
VDLSFTSEQEDLRARARDWLARHHPGPLPPDLAGRHRVLRAWQQELYDAGWVGLGWPREYGGQGGSAVDQIVFNQELARAKAPPPVGLVSLEVVGPTILRFGTEAQRRRHVAPLLRGDELWCQGFSEPGAGSDLASLETRATLEGDGFVVSGHKIWTTWAQYAEWCAVLARTRPDAPRHAGISYLLVDMRSPGITVRPIAQMTGDEEFSEIFFDAVRVPGENVLGPLHGGWTVAMDTLQHERGPAALRRQVEFRVALDDLVEQLLAADHPDLDDPAVLERLGECEVLVEVMQAQGYRTVDRIRQDALGEETSIEKLLLTETDQRLFTLALELLHDPRTATALDDSTLDRARWIHDYLFSRAASIYGGTSQIQRTIVAQRLLRLPKG